MVALLAALTVLGLGAAGIGTATTNLPGSIAAGLSTGSPPIAPGQPLEIGSPLAASESGASSVLAASAGSEYPAERWGAGMAYDASDGSVILFGGSNGGNVTWAFSDDSWNEVKTSKPPVSRNYPCLTYDWSTSAIILFGGAQNGMSLPKGELNDTWSYSHGTWTRLHPANSPPALDWQSCAYDSAAAAVVLFGGAQGTGTSTEFNGNETWEFKVTSATGPNGNWTEVRTLASGTPPGRFGASMAYDAQCQIPGSALTGCVVLYGGARNGSIAGDEPCNAATSPVLPNNCQYLHDTWEFQSGNWTNVTATAGATTPPGVLWATMTNSTDGSVLIFGGQANANKSPTVAQADTFEFSNGSWQRISGTPAPGTRFGTALASIPGGPTILFSGLAGTVRNTPLRDDTWSFSNGQWTPLTYPILFRETGLPVKVDPKPNDTFENYTVPQWGVSVTNATSFSFVNSTEIDRPNGTYSYSVRAPTGFVTSVNASGTVRVTGGTAEVNVSFAPKYTVNFTETGLPVGTEWWVNLTHGPKSESTTSTLSFKEPNGTYVFTVATADPTYRSTGGSLTIAGADLNESAKFVLVKYKVTFRETGLPAGTEWWVNLTTGQRYHTTGSSLSFRQPNGTYSYTTGSAKTGYAGSKGTFAVDGAKVAIKTKFQSDEASSALGPRASILSLMGSRRSWSPT